MKPIRAAAALVLLTMALFFALLAVRRLAGCEGFDPYWIDYDRPGIDMTSEGP